MGNMTAEGNDDRAQGARTSCAVTRVKKRVGSVATGHKMFYEFTVICVCIFFRFHLIRVIAVIRNMQMSLKK